MLVEIIGIHHDTHRCQSNITIIVYIVIFFGEEVLLLTR